MPAPPALGASGRACDRGQHDRGGRRRPARLDVESARAQHAARRSVVTTRCPSPAPRGALAVACDVLVRCAPQVSRRSRSPTSRAAYYSATFHTSGATDALAGAESRVPTSQNAGGITCTKRPVREEQPVVCRSRAAGGETTPVSGRSRADRVTPTRPLSERPPFLGPRRQGEPGWSSLAAVLIQPSRLRRSSLLQA